MHPPSVLAYLERIGAEVLNFRRAMVKTFKGHYYIERAIIKIESDGSVTCSNKEFMPTAEEAKAMKAELEKIVFPKAVRATTTRKLKEIAKGELFEFIDQETDEIIMVQERVVTKNLVKAYVPWVLMDDNTWNKMEPDGPLPFWKPKRSDIRQVMIHEGAKAAKAVTDMIAAGGRGHPWYETLKEYQHWGMIGGALAPHRTDYDELRRISPTEVVYVCDNDQPGVSALQKVSYCWDKSLKSVKFGAKFPEHWDMADPMPENLFASTGRYIGPALADLMDSATFATEEFPNPEGKGRPIQKIKPEFAEEWVHCVTPEVFLNRHWPNRIFTLSEFNNRVSPFSKVDDTARLLKKDYASKGLSLKYVPSEIPGIHGGDGSSGSYVNTFQGSTIKPEKGDIAPFLDFMQNLVIEDHDRHEVLRWCATLIARPDIKMLYGVLMISEMQGVGKGTLGEKILAPLVGDANVSYPSEQEIVDSNYNYWISHKRLAVVHEIYAGNSSKAYNKLKSCITDKNITVQKKYQANYDIDSWIHIFACSNSMRALKLSNDDRRWLVPKLSEQKRPPIYWQDFNSWLKYDGGLNIIAQWAINFCEEHGPVPQGAPAPSTSLKRSMIEEGYSPGQVIVMRTIQDLKDKIEEGSLPQDTFILDTQLVEVIKQQLYDGRHNDRLEKPHTVRAVAKGMGMTCGEIRAQVRGWGYENFGARILSFDPETAMAVPSDLGGEKLDPENRKKPYALIDRM
jgi:hypothetical protein